MSDNSLYINKGEFLQSPIVIDYIFPNKAAMDETATNPKIYLNRYVLVNYCINYAEAEGITAFATGQTYYKKYEGDGDIYYKVGSDETFDADTTYYIKTDVNSGSSAVTENKSVNLIADGNAGNGIYHGTVWKKVCINGNFEYEYITTLAEFDRDGVIISYILPDQKSKTEMNDDNTYGIILSENASIDNDVDFNYNEEGFSKYNISDEEDEAEFTPNWDEDDTWSEDETYTKKLSLNIPSIGNTVSKIKDFVYGHKSDDSFYTGTETGNTDDPKQNNINTVLGLYNKLLAFDEQTLQAGIESYLQNNVPSSTNVVLKSELDSVEEDKDTARGKYEIIDDLYSQIENLQAQLTKNYSMEDGVIDYKYFIPVPHYYEPKRKKHFNFPKYQQDPDNQCYNLYKDATKPTVYMRRLQIDHNNHLAYLQMLVTFKFRKRNSDNLPKTSTGINNNVLSKDHGGLVRLNAALNSYQLIGTISNYYEDKKGNYYIPVKYGTGDDDYVWIFHNLKGETDRVININVVNTGTKTSRTLQLKVDGEWKDVVSNTSDPTKYRFILKRKGRSIKDRSAGDRVFFFEDYISSIAIVDSNSSIGFKKISTNLTPLWDTPLSIHGDEYDRTMDCEFTKQGTICIRTENNYDYNKTYNFQINGWFPIREDYEMISAISTETEEDE